MKFSSFFLFLIPFLGTAQSNVDDLYADDSLRHLYISFYVANYHSILNVYNGEIRLPAEVVLGDVTLDSVAVKYKGNSTRRMIASESKKPFNIHFDDIIQGQDLLGYKKMKLSNAWFDPTFVKETIAANIYRRYLSTAEVNLLKVSVKWCKENYCERSFDSSA